MFILKENIMIKKWHYLFLFALFFSSCQTGRYVNFSDNKEIKIAIYNDNEREFLENLILYKKYDVEMIYNGNFLTIKNINEDIIIDILIIIQLNLDIIADNMANVNTTRTSKGGPYIRKYLNITIEDGIEIIEDTRSPLRIVYDPIHPDAIKTGEMEGYLKMPNVDIVLETVDMIAKNRLYERIFEHAKNIYKNIIW
jgi:flagellar basal-body rod protein FlgC